MEELDLTLMQRDEASFQPLKPAFRKFEETARVPVHPVIHNWTNGRSDLIRIALYHHGADVSEVGTTWISDLISMNTLRPFTKAEVEALGPEQAFLSAAWKTTHFTDDPTIWSIPWLAEAYSLHYRKDVLHKVGINERTAFASPEQLYETACQLREAGYDLPIALPPASLRTLMLHVAASWVWQAGGEFMSPDSKSVSFNEPPALRGFANYFRLALCISPAGQNLLDNHSAIDLFASGKAAMALGSLWLHPRNMPEGAIDPSNWGVTRLPGPPFVGGTNLVVWKHTHQDQNALNLIKLLSNEDVSSHYAYAIGMLPARTRPLSLSPFNEDRFSRVIFESIQLGRTYPNFPLWGLVEERLANTLAGIWNAICGNPQEEPETIIERMLNQVARSLNITLSQQ